MLSYFGRIDSIAFTYVESSYLSITEELNSARAPVCVHGNNLAIAVLRDIQFSHGKLFRYVTVFVLFS